MPTWPAHFPDALIRLPPTGLEPVEDLARQRPRGVGGLEPALPRHVQRVDDLAVDIELELIGGAVSDPYRLGALVAGQPRQLELDQASLPRDAVHHLDVLGIAGDRTQQPVPPRARFVDVARSQEGEESERRVAQPAVPVVPVTDPAERFRKRGRRGGDDPSGRRVRERLQREERPARGLRPAPGGGATPDPLLPVVDGLLESVLGIHRLRQRLVRRSPGQDERHAIARLDRELRVRAEIPALESRRAFAPRPHPARRWRRACSSIVRTHGTMEP